MSHFPEQRDPGAAEDTLAAPVPKTPRRIRMLQGIAVILIVAALTLLLHGLLTPAASTTPTAATTRGHATIPAAVATATAAPADPLVGHYAPNVTVHDMRDHLTSIASLRGSVVLLNFWYVSCPPCQLEMPGLERAYLAHQAQGFKVVGLNTGDDAATISAFTTRIGITYPILRDIGERTVLAYQVRATPSSFLIDRAGVIRAVYIGPVNITTLDAQLGPLLAQR